MTSVALIVAIVLVVGFDAAVRALILEIGIVQIVLSCATVTRYPKPGPTGSDC